MSNPAGRLHSVIASAAAVPNENNKLRAREAFRVSMGVPEDDEALLIKRFGVLLTLPAEIRTQIQRLPLSDHELFLRNLPTIEAALRDALGGSWTQIWGRIEGVPMQSLEFCSAQLDAAGLEPLVDEDEIAELRAQIHDLYVELLTSELSGELRLLLLRHLHAMLEAIEEVRLRGVAALSDAAESAVGAAVLYEHRSGEPPAPDAKGFWDRFVAVAGKVLVVVGLLNQGLELTEATLAELPPVVDLVVDQGSGDKAVGDH